MQLTKHTDFAFRALIYLATDTSSHLATTSDISDAYDISHNHVVKVVQKLSRAGFITSTRGRNGGISLAKPPDAINVADVVEQMEQTLTPANCTNPECVILACCTLRRVLAEAQSEYLRHLSTYSLEDLVKNEALESVLHVKQ